MWLVLNLEKTTVKEALTFVLQLSNLSYKIVNNTLIVGDQSKLDTPTTLVTKTIKINNIKLASAKGLFQVI